MAIYDWRCCNLDCKNEVQVTRPMADYLKGPDEACEKCGSATFEKFIAEWSPYQSQLIFGGSVPWHNEAYTRLGKPTGR